MTLAGALALGAGLSVLSKENAAYSATVATTAEAPAETPAETPATPDPVRRTPVVEAVERVAPAVVSITTTTQVNDPFAGLFGPRVASGEGSGVVIQPDGVVLTNAHVVNGAQQIVATLTDGSQYEARILGLDPELDLAVLRMEGVSGLTAVPIGTSADLMLGEPTIAIGNPLGLGHTVTTGVISAVSRPLRTDWRVYQDFIQTDASINPGNSGGPLLNAHGELIGINTAIRPDAQNIGFAIPVDRAMKVARDLLTFGTVQAPWLGIDLVDVRTDRHGGTAPRVERVYDGSSAEKAGLRPGDILLTLEGRAVQSRADVNAYLASFDPGRVLKLTWTRGGAQMSGAVRGERLPDAVVDHVLADMLGVAVVDRSGVVVATVLPNGAFDRSGLRVGDIIAAVNDQEVHSTDEFRLALAQAKGGHRTSALFTIRRGSSYGRLTFSI